MRKMLSLLSLLSAQPRRYRTLRNLIVAIAALIVGMIGAVQPAYAQTGAESFCGTDFGRADWNTPAWGTILTEVTLRIQVGNDDIRSGTSVYAWLHIKNSVTDKWVSVPGPINGYANFPNNSLLQVKIPLTDPSLGLVTPENIQDVFISYVPGMPDVFSSPDNWNMNAIRILYPKNSNLHPPLATAIDWSQYNQLLFGSGSPWLHRFKMSCDSEGGPTWQATNPFWNRI